MSSSQVPVFPIHAISYGVDRSITNPGDVMRHLQAFQKTVEVVPVENWVDGPKQVYRLKHGGIEDGDVQLFKFSLGHVEVSISYDPVSTAIVLQAYLSAPIMGTVSVGEVSGSLKEGVIANFGFGTESIFSGEVGAQLKDKDGYLSYHFHDFREHLKGEVRIF